MTRRTFWLLPYTFLGTGVEPVCSTFGIAMLRLDEIEKQLTTATLKRTDPNAHRIGAVEHSSSGREQPR
jgi:hypothetical protein